MELRSVDTMKKAGTASLSKVRRFVRKMGTVAKAFSIYCVLCAVLVLFVATRIQSMTTARALNSAGTAGQETAGMAASTAGYALRATYTTYRNAAKTAALRQAVLSEAPDADAQAALLELFSAGNPAAEYVDSVYVVNAMTGDVYASNNNSAPSGSFFDKEALSLLKSNVKFTSRMAQFKLFGQQYFRRYLTCTFPIISSNAATVGGLIVNIDEEKLMSAIGVRPEYAEYLYITDLSGTIIAHTDSATIGLDVGKEVMEGVSENTGNQFTAKCQGEKCIVNYTKDATLQMLFISAYPEKLARDGAVSTWLLVVIALVIAMVVGFIVAIIVLQVNEARQRKAAAARTSLTLDDFAVWNAPYSRDLDTICSATRSNNKLLEAKKSEVVLCWAQGGFGNSEACTAQLKRCGIDLPAPLYLCIVITPDNYAAQARSSVPQNLQLAKYAAVHTAAEQLNQRYNCVVSENGEDYGVVIINCSTEDDFSFVRNVLTNVQNVMNNKLGMSVSCGIGTYAHGMDNVPQSFRDAKTAADFRLLLGHEHITAYENIREDAARAVAYPAKEAAVLAEGKLGNATEDAAQGFITALGSAGVESAAANAQYLRHQMMLGEGDAPRAAGLLAECDTLSGMKDILLAMSGNRLDSMAKPVDMGTEPLEKHRAKKKAAAKPAADESAIAATTEDTTARKAAYKPLTEEELAAQATAEATESDDNTATTENADGAVATSTDDTVPATETEAPASKAVPSKGKNRRNRRRANAAAHKATEQAKNATDAPDTDEVSAKKDSDTAAAIASTEQTAEPASDVQNIVSNASENITAAEETITNAVDTTAKTAKKGKPAADNKEKKPDIAKAACKYIQKHYSDEGLGIDDIAKSLGVSEGYLRTTFRSAMNMAPAEYIVQVRLDKAKDLLLNTDISSKDIAERIGYNSRYFYSLFKSRMGMTTKEFREQNGKGGAD